MSADMVLRSALSGMAAVFSVLLLPGVIRFVWWLFRAGATGLAATSNRLVAALLTPAFWISALVLFAFFFFASRFQSKVLRVVLFWIPTLSVSVISIALLAFWAYAMIFTRRS